MSKIGIILVCLCFSFSHAFADVEQASPEQFATLIGGEDTLLVDVRTPAETAQAKIQGAIEINFNAPDFAEQIAQLPKEKKILLYCRSGNRSGKAATYLDLLGYEKLVNLTGGMIAWTAEGRPTISNDTGEQK